MEPNVSNKSNYSSDNLELSPLNLAINQGSPSIVRELLKNITNIPNMINGLSPRPIKDEDLLQQIDLVLNFDKNRGNEIEKIKNLFRTYNKVLNTGTSDDFKISMLNSEVYLNSILLKKTVPFTSPYILDKDAFEDLKKDNSNSFLIIPVHSSTHTFSVVVRRSEEGFNATIVNRENQDGNYRKETNNSYAQYEEYFFKEKNIDKLIDILNGPRLADPIDKETFAIYKDFRTNSDIFSPLNITSRIQLKGNCFVKEPESAILFAFATRNFDNKQLVELRNNTSNFKPKWEPSTTKIHQLYINEQIKANPHLSKEIQIKFDRYILEKQDRKLVSVARTGNNDKLNELIHKNVNLNARDASQNTSLIWATLHGHTKVVETLIEAVADVNAKNSKGWSALHAAALTGNTPLVKKLLLAGARIDEKGIIDDSPLYLASKNGHFETAKELINLGAELISPMKLNYIAKEGHLSIVNEFLNKGVVPDNEILIASAAGGHLDVVKEFIKSGININLKDEDYGRTALIQACIHGHSEVVEELISKGADVNLPDNDGTPPLIHAAESDNSQIVNLLLTHGAKVNTKNDLELSPILAASRKGNCQTIKELMAFGADIHVQDRAGLNSLMWSAKIGSNPTINELIKAGASLDVIDKKGNTALILAAKSGQLDAVKTLVKSGAKLDIQNNDRNTALHAAAKNCKKDHKYTLSNYTNIVKVLFDANSAKKINDKEVNNPKI